MPKTVQVARPPFHFSMKANSSILSPVTAKEITVVSTRFNCAYWKNALRLIAELEERRSAIIGPPSGAKTK